MNVLINLLPDTRQVKQRDRRRRQFVSGAAIMIWVVCGIVLLLLTLYTASQKILINNATNTIKQKEAEISGLDGLTDALTAQQHLAALPGLYGQRAYFTKFFAAYSEANPTEVALTSMNIDATNGLIVNGSAKSYAAAAKLAKALQAEHVTIGKDANQAADQPYFLNVAIQSANRSNNSISFTLTATLASGVTNGN